MAGLVYLFSFSDSDFYGRRRIVGSKSVPVELHFFPNSTTALLASASDGTIYVTHDEGRTWQEADLPPDEHRDVTMHPYDNRFAFLTTLDGNIYRTSNQVMTWQPVEPPAPPSSYRNHFTFHSKEPGVVLFDGKRCVPSQRWPEEKICYTDYYITRDGFSSEATLLLRNAQMCLFSSSLGDVADKEHPDLILCVVVDESESPQQSSRLLASTDYFQNDKRVIDITLDGTPYQISDITSRGKFAIAFLKSHNPQDHNLLKVISPDLQHWERLLLPSPRVHYYPVSTFLLTESKLGTFKGYLGLPFTLYISDAKGNNFVKSLENVIITGRSGTFEYDRIEGVEHVIMMSVAANPNETRGLDRKELRSRISFDDGSTWRRLTPSLDDAANARVACNPNHEEACSLHFHRRTLTRFVFNLKEAEGTGISSPAPWVTIRVGSIGSHLAPYEDCDTFISTDSGFTWRRIVSGPYRFAYTDHGSVVAFVKDVDDTDEVLYSIDSGQSWNVVHLGHTIIPFQLSPSSILTSEKFLIGLIRPQNNLHKNRNLEISSLEVLVISLEFSSLGRQERTAGNGHEKWYLQDGEPNGCILGHNEWYLRRRMQRDCRISEDFHLNSIKGIEENYSCERNDYECDANFIRQDDVCVSMIPDAIREDTCQPNNKYSTPTGYRLKVGDTCDKDSGVILDEPVEKYCDSLEMREHEEGHGIFVVPTPVETVLTECPRSKWDL
ncbi:VPS10_3 [Sanghuangporus sanghuang]